MRSIGAAVTAVLLVLVAAASAAAADREPHDRLVSVEGARGSLHVEILVQVPAGASASAASARVLAGQGAAPAAAESLGRAAYTLSGLVWTQMPIVQRLSRFGEPISPQAELLAAQETWSSVPGSSLRFAFGGVTATCPSLSPACPGPPGFDGRSDVGWSPLPPGALAATWYAPGVEEADLVLNTLVDWAPGCAPGPDQVDLLTVLLHEEGHVAGLGHSEDPSAVMAPSYDLPRCELAEDDEAAVRAL